MVEDNVIFETTKTNNKLLCDVETLLGMAYVLLILEAIRGLSKFTYSFVSFFFAIKFIEANLFVMYCGIEKRYSPMHFYLLLISLNTVVILCV
jgi:hypothetical protein